MKANWDKEFRYVPFISCSYPFIHTHIYTCSHLYIDSKKSQFVGTRQIINKYIIWKKSSNIYMWSGIKEFMVVELFAFQNIYRTISGREHEVFIFDKEKDYLHYVLWLISFQICINIYVSTFPICLLCFNCQEFWDRRKLLYKHKFRENITLMWKNLQ